MNVILGAGLAGLSASYHLGHEHCLILEKAAVPFGHAHSELRGGFTWDEGPHVSFTKHDYVKELFARSVDGDYEAHDVRTVNYFQGHWVDHPAQCNLYQVPEPIRSRCLDSFLARPQRSADDDARPANYQEWLEEAFGVEFARIFPEAYTRKYWTVEPADLNTEWVGERMYSPATEEVQAGAKGPLPYGTHYITHARYPRRGGYQAFLGILVKEARIRYHCEVERIDLAEKKLWLTSGECLPYGRLISTLPLPVFVQRCAQATAAMREAAAALNCSQLLLVNATAPHPTLRAGNWFYIYDEDKLSTRINCTERLSPFNAPPGHTGVQVEVYFGRHRPLPEPPAAVGQRVLRELVEMGFIAPDQCGPSAPAFHTHEVRWANVIFDHQRRAALDSILNWLTAYGLQREANDLDASTDWGHRDPLDLSRATLMLGGRFGQWKYFWTDDCLLRGRQLAQGLRD